MSFPSSNSHQDASSSSTSSPTSALRNARSQQSVWGSAASQQQSVRRGPTPISTAPTTSGQANSTSSPSRNAFSPTSSAFNAPLSQTGRQATSRHSSASSSSSLFSPLAPSSQQPLPGQLHTSSRSRNITSSGSPHLPSSAAGLSSTAQGGVGGGSGGGAARFARASPSLSLSTTGSPISSSTQSSGLHSAAASGQLTSLVITQLNILLSTIKEDKDRAKWETQADKIWKVSRRCDQHVASTLLTPHIAG